MEDLFGQKSKDGAENRGPESSLGNSLQRQYLVDYWLEATFEWAKDNSNAFPQQSSDYNLHFFIAKAMCLFGIAQQRTRPEGMNQNLFSSNYRATNWLVGMTHFKWFFHPSSMPDILWQTVSKAHYG
ncbi:hypothetical protein PGTUg99_030522 [Puccinia graminis f. sp. tritici]|uniref:Uncharacterized protein n=1 Tax=Puccinia graminis f. sp. tritici TaxID=56615 RepID=A0A5B0SP07_PUCGR|nr:hypothetical protein PGTUg99_030522 [Puccinia graminis f. sp. tritici]